MSVFVKSGGGENVTPEVQAQTPLVTEILESLVGKVTLANATPEAILEGYSAYVGRELVNGTYSRKYLVDSGDVALTANQTQININHNLNKKPIIYFIYPTSAASGSAAITEYFYPYYTNGGVGTRTTAGFSSNKIFNEKSIMFDVSGGGYYFQGGITYRWVAIA